MDRAVRRQGRSIVKLGNIASSSRPLLRWAILLAGQQNVPASAGAVFRRHKGRCAMSLAVLKGHFCQWPKVGQSGRFSALFASSSPWQRQVIAPATRSRTRRRISASIRTVGSRVSTRCRVKPVHVGQVRLVSVSRSNSPFHNTLWKSCHLSGLGSFVRFSHGVRLGV